MKFPIIGVCDNSVSVYESIERAICHIEPIDIEDSVWNLYDCDGKVLELTLGSITRDQPVISDPEIENYRPHILAGLIASNLCALSNRTKKKLGILGLERGVSSMPLSTLVKLAQRAFLV